MVLDRGRTSAADGLVTAGRARLGAWSTVRHGARYFFRAPLTVPFWDRHEIVALLGTLARGQVVEGPAVERLERAVGQCLGSRHVIGTNLGRTAIALALHAIGIRPGAEVVLPTFLCDVVAQAVVRAEAVPVLCDIDEDWNIAPASVARAITGRTAAVVVAHMYGRPARIEEIIEIARPRGIRVIEDAAQAFGGRRGGRALGTFGDVGILSMYLGKSVVAGGGGFLLTDDDDLFRRASAFPFERLSAGRVLRRAARVLWVHRLRRQTYPFVYATRRLFGTGYHDPPTAARLSNLEAAVGLVQLTKLTPIIRRRRENAFLLRDLLAGDDRFELPEPTDEHVFTRFVLRLRGDLGPAGPLGRPRGYVEFVRHMNRARVEVEWQYRPLHLGTEFATDPCPPRPTADARWEAAIALPVQPGLDADAIRHVAVTARSYRPPAG